MTLHKGLITPDTIANETVWTWPNLVTLIRTVGGLALFALAAITDAPQWNMLGLAIYWSLDTLDGYLARLLKQETRFGAQMDILADRLLVAFFYLNYLSWHPAMVVPIVLFMLHFMVLDHYLSNQFMRWPIISPNYFYQVDQRIWLLNWSMPGKALNSGLVTIILIATESQLLAIGLILALIVVKIYSCVRLHRLPQPPITELPLASLSVASGEARSGSVGVAAPHQPVIPEA
jgi:CDP-diacylglycerol--glycerol-3-phosphate 3-phosphatidyltransferase